MRWTRLGNFPEEVTLGDLKARIAKIDGRVAEGIDPEGPPKGQAGGKKPTPAHSESANDPRLAAILGDRPIVAGSFGDLARRYLVQHVWSLRRPRDIEAAIARHMVPAWRDLPASMIRRRDAAEIIAPLKEAGKLTAARRLRSYIHGVFSHGISEDLFDEGNRIEINPAAGIKGLGREQRRTDHLREDQIRTLWCALEARAGRYLVSSMALEMLLFTAQRPGEVFGMRWDEIRDGWWRLPGSRTKNGLDHLVPLVPAALSILERVRPLTGQSEHVFESRKTPGDAVTVTGMSSVYSDVCKAAGIPLEPKPFGPHGLRRTAATLMSELGTSDEVIDAVQNHLKPGVRKNYNLNAYRREKSEALLALEAHILRVVHAREEDAGRL